MNALLQVSPFSSDGGALIGRDPREIPAEDWKGHPALIGLKAVRAKCLDCNHTPAEVRKCVQTACPLWPLRMGSIPKGLKNALRSASEERECSAGMRPQAAPESQQNTAHESQIDAESV